MTTEQKAKAYDEALKVAKDIRNGEATYIPNGTPVIEAIFPELAVSDDEKIRKSLLDYLYTLPNHFSHNGGLVTDWIAWLEKQGEHSIYNVPSREVILAIWELGNEWKELTGGSISTEHGTQLDYIQKHWEESEYYLKEKQGEQPRYSIGDVLCDKSCTTLNKDAQPNFEIVDIRNGMYICDKVSFPISQQDEYELVAKKIEQKHIDKIEPKHEPKFHIGDWVVVSTTKGDRVVQIASVEYFKGGYPSYITTEGRWFGNGTWARLLTDKDMETITLPESKVIVNQNPAWSKEDEKIWKELIEEVKDQIDSVPSPDCRDKEDEKVLKQLTRWLDWLKSLKDRYTWKPSEEQMDTLEYYMHTLVCNEYKEILFGLYADLKKLMEE